MKTTEFEFSMATGVMPTDPIELRGQSRESGRMIVLDRTAQTIEHSVFSHIGNHLRAGDLLVLNDSYMLSNTLPFEREGEAVHVVVYGHEPDGTNIVEVKPGQGTAGGETMICTVDRQLSCTLVDGYAGGLWKARFTPAASLVTALDRFGCRSDETVPLDAKHWKETPEAYRSVYAKTPGSLEIPSAGLHFSKALLESLTDAGVELAFITLHVGATEILAVRHIDEEESEHHKVRPEYCEVNEEAAGQISRALRENRRIVAVGTTVMRTLESLALHAASTRDLQASKLWTDLYIYPGFQFKVVDALVTNLRRPRSSHIVLTAAFAGKDLVMRSYAEILADGGYEFDMFGDSMLIV